MSQNLWISSDESIDWENRSWITNRHIFKNIFDRVNSFFKSFECDCKEACFYDWGMEGIDLSAVDKDCFNIFYIRVKVALDNYPDQKEIEYQNMNPDQRGSHEHVIWEWMEIIKRLELDKRFDAVWIEAYLRRCG